MIANKYGKALFEVLTPEEREQLRPVLKGLGEISKEPKFLLVMKSPLLSIEQKLEFIKEITGVENPKLLNFVKILIINRRIELLKPIYQVFNKLVADSTGRYEGVVEGDIEEEVIPQLEEMLGKKFNSTVKLQLKRRKVGGIKLFIDVLNVEVELVEKRLKENLIQLILKAI